MNVLGEEVIRCMKSFRDNTFVLLKDEAYTYEEIFSQIEELRTWLVDCGVKPYERIAIIFKNNSIKFLNLTLAVIILDCICCPVAPIVFQQNTEELQADWIVDDESVPIPNTEFVASFKGIRLSKNSVSPTGGDWLRRAAFILPTSGTSGKMKWVVLSHNNILSNVQAIKAYKQPNNSDVFMLVKHLGHISTITSDLMLCLLSGARIVVNDSSFNPQKVNFFVRQYGVTILTLVPTMFQLMLRYNPKEYLANLKKVSLVGAPTKPELLLRIAEVLPETRIYCGYGLTEAASRVSYLPPDKLLDKIGAIGFPIDGVSIKLVLDGKVIEQPEEIGEIIVSGPGVMIGYIQEGKLEILSGELATNDLAYRDSDGYYYHVGRKDDILVINGNNVSAINIEKVLEGIPQVESAHVFIYQADPGIDILAVLVVVKPDTNLNQEEVYHYAKNRLASSLVPKKIWISTEIPGSDSGKISRKKLAQYYSDLQPV